MNFLSLTEEARTLAWAWVTMMMGNSLWTLSHCLSLNMWQNISQLLAWANCVCSCSVRAWGGRLGGRRHDVCLQRLGSCSVDCRHPRRQFANFILLHFRYVSFSDLVTTTTTTFIWLLACPRTIGLYNKDCWVELSNSDIRCVRQSIFTIFWKGVQVQVPSLCWEPLQALWHRSC